MCDNHSFQFDVDKAFENQLAAALEASPKHPVTSPEAPKSKGVYALYLGDDPKPVYVGLTHDAKEGIKKRLREHLSKAQNRVGLDVQQIAWRFLVIEGQRDWEIARAEAALIDRYDPEWNKIRGFGSHAPGSGRPGMPGYTAAWDQVYPEDPSKSSAKPRRRRTTRASSRR